MQLETAVSLIEKGVVKNDNPQSWMDLGAGAGLFTTALASLLPSGRSILAVDKDARALKTIKVCDGISPRTLNQDFTSISFQEKYDGVLMANALHYVSDAVNFVKHLKSISNRLIIIEYDRTTANQWVPYPIDFEKLNNLSHDAGFRSVIKSKEVPSVYDDVSIYSAG